MEIRAAAEDYLETILVLTKKQGKVRSVDIANYMNYSKPTISVFMKQLRENGYIEMDGGGYIALTEKGAEIAGRTYERHNILAKFLMGLGVDEETAYEDSCKIEHVISEKSINCIRSVLYPWIKNDDLREV